jgi:hypothetical protein
LSATKSGWRQGAGYIVTLTAVLGISISVWSQEEKTDTGIEPPAAATIEAPAAAAGEPTPAAEKKAAAMLGDVSDGSLATPIHVIKLYDDVPRPDGKLGSVINPAAEPALPFSMRTTCGQCHDYQTISSGWHFNAAEGTSSVGRIGQPWIYVDWLTRTQIPLSYRGWAGTWRPDQAGLTEWGFAKLFARQSAGNFKEKPNPSQPDLEARWAVSGPIESDCMVCHDAEPSHDSDEYAYEIMGPENFRWAPTAACGFASMTGSAKRMDEFWDYTIGMPPDNPQKIPPTVVYDKYRFDDKHQIFIDITRKTPADRCYFCHTSVDMDVSGNTKWKADQDVHLMAGLTCVDCHRHGLDHMITRGYEGEPTASHKDATQVANLSCKGCHLGVEESSTPTAGRLGAPRPLHQGIPTVHFDRLTCTACHSGPWPGDAAHRFKTAMAHGLGLKNSNKAPEALPHIQATIFTEQNPKVIGPNYLVWPAFWGRLAENKVTPIPPQAIKEAAEEILVEGKAAVLGDWRPLTKEQIIKVLQKLAPAQPNEPKAVYVAGGTMYSLENAEGQPPKLVETKHKAANPCVWPMAHNVRPASQSLGLGGAAGCAHCHSEKSGFFDGNVKIDTPVEGLKEAGVVMVSMQKSVNPTYAKYFSLSFIFRPWMKAAIFAAAGIIACVLLLGVLKALSAIAKAATGRNTNTQK